MACPGQKEPHIVSVLASIIYQRRPTVLTLSGNRASQGTDRPLAMTQVTGLAAAKPQDDLQTVVETRTREWHFHIYFLLQSPTETAAALALRDAVLRLRRDGK